MKLETVYIPSPHNNALHSPSSSASLDSRQAILQTRHIIKLSERLVALGVGVLAIKGVLVNTLLTRAVNVKVVALPPVLSRVEVVRHAENALVDGLVGAHALKEGRVLNGDELALVGGAGEVDYADAAEVALVHGRLCFACVSFGILHNVFVEWAYG